MIDLYCPHCGTELPDDAVFCMKCGTNLAAERAKTAQPPPSVVAPTGELKPLNCPSCGAPLAPQFGEMLITCEYCGTTIALGNNGWNKIAKQTMLPLALPSQEQVLTKLHGVMDTGLFHRHLQETSKLEEMNLRFVPYWIISASARTSVVAMDVATEAGEIATTAAIIGLMGGAMGGGRRGGARFGAPVLTGAMLGGTMGMGRGRNPTKTHELDNNYNFPIVALKALTQLQPKDYVFDLEQRTFFDIAKIPKGVKILNGDVGEEAARYQAKTLVDQLQSDRAHAQFHMIQQLHTEVDVSEAELLHAPIWFARYDHDGTKITLVIDGNSGGIINSVGLAGRPIR